MKDDYKKYIKKVNIYRNEPPLWLVIIFKSIFTAFLICCLIVALFNFTHIGTPVSGSSMKPTLNNYQNLTTKDYVYISRFVGYGSSDIIVINNPENENTNKFVIKRLIATEGDKLAIIRTDGGIYSVPTGTYKIVKLINNEIVEISEPYLPEGTSLYWSYLEWEDLISKPEITGAKKIVFNGITFLEIQSGYVFYMGDNRSSKSASKDCLEYGPVEKSKVVGKVSIIAYENKNHFSHIFMHYIHKIFG